MEEEEEEEEEEEDSEARERMRAALTDRFEEENEAVTSLQVCLYNMFPYTDVLTYSRIMCVYITLCMQ